MSFFTNWWKRRRLLARLQQHRQQRRLLSIQHQKTLDQLQTACQDLIKYRANTQTYAARIVPARMLVCRLSSELRMIDLEVKDHLRNESFLTAELEQ